MGNAARRIFFIFAGIAGAAALTLGFVAFRQEESTDREMRRSLAELSARVDGIEAAFSREIADGSSGTQGAIRRLQRKLGDDIAAVRAGLSEMALALDRRKPVAAPAPAAIAPAAPAAPPASAAPESGPAAVLVAAPSSTDVMEMDLALSQALQRAKEYYNLGKFAEAVRVLSPFSPQQASFPEVRLYLAASRFRANAADSRIQPRVEQELRAALQEDPGNLVAVETMGALCMEQGRWTEARDWFLQVIALKPSDADALEKTGMCALSAADPATAQACFERAAAIRPGDANLWYESGSAFAAAGKLEEALVRFEKCLVLEPGHRGALDQAARCLADRAPGAGGQQE